MDNILPTYSCLWVAGPVLVDGNLDKPVWREIPPIHLQRADGSGSPHQATTARACWDGAHLYLAFECIDREIRATFRERDAKVWQEEAVEAFIAPYGDALHYLEFQCSPANVVRDVLVTNPNARGEGAIFDGSWDCQGWQTAVQVRGRLNEAGEADQRWWVEWGIPLASLLPEGAGQVLAGEEWRVNLFRIDRWPEVEYSAWSPNPSVPPNFHQPRFFGRWLFV